MVIREQFFANGIQNLWRKILILRPKMIFCSKMRYDKITSEITWMEGTSGQHFINFRAQSHVRGNPVGQRQERNPRVAR